MLDNDPAMLASVALAYDAVVVKHADHDQSTHGRGGSGTGSEPRRIRNAREARAWGEENYSEWQDGLSESEAAAVERYTSTRHYATVNEYLRTGSADGEERIARQMQRELDSALESSSVPEDVIAYRGVGRDAFGEGNLEDMVGETFTDRGYVSTALNPRAANAFGDSIVMRVSVPSGSRGAYVGGLSDNPSEGELLLPRGSSFVITSVSESGSNTFIDVEYTDG